MSCFKCDLSITRTNVVLGIGNSKSDTMLVGEAPGYHEDKKGIPFIGQSGVYLRELLELAGLNESNLYITNVVKCRPPKNRDPFPDEINTCVKYFLSKEIDFVNPVFIITAGRIATSVIIGNSVQMRNCVGHDYKIGKRWVLPIYHPSYTLQHGGEDSYKETILNVKTTIDKIRHDNFWDINANFPFRGDVPF